MEDTKPVAIEDQISDEDLEIVELPQREAMSKGLLNLHIHNLFHGLF